MTGLVTPSWLYISPAALLQFLKYPLQIRLGLPGWKSRFHREYFGIDTSNEIGKLQNEMVMFFLAYSFILMDPLPLRRGKVAFCICYNLLTLSFSLHLNLDWEVSRRTLLGVPMLFCWRTIMELVRTTCLHLLNIKWSQPASYGTTCCRHYTYNVAPFVSDLKGLSRFEISFTVDKPLRPFDQLMAVLPFPSRCLFPACYRWKIMGRQEYDYPKLHADMDGEHFWWTVSYSIFIHPSGLSANFSLHLAMLIPMK